MVDPSGILTFGLWAPDAVLEEETVYITQLEVNVSLEDVAVSVEVDA